MTFRWLILASLTPLALLISMVFRDLASISEAFEPHHLVPNAVAGVAFILPLSVLAWVDWKRVLDWRAILPGAAVTVAVALVSMQVFASLESGRSVTEESFALLLKTIGFLIILDGARTAKAKAGVTTCAIALLSFLPVVSNRVLWAMGSAKARISDDPTSILVGLVVVALILKSAYLAKHIRSWKRSGDLQ